MFMEDTTLALTLSRVRIALGAVAVAAPGTTARILTGRPRADGVEPQLARMLGGRDLALGLGTVIALDKGTPVRGWLEACALADGGDCISALLGRKHMSQRAFIGTLVASSAAAALGLLLAGRLDPPPDAHPGQAEAVVTGHHE